MKIKSALIFVIILSLILYFTSENTMNDDTSTELYELPENCDFMQVRANNSVQFDCSPRLKDPYFSDFRGLLINAPKEVIWPADVSIDDYVIYPDGSNDSPLRLNIAGLSNVPDSTLGLSGDVAYEIVVVAVNQENAESYSGKMVRMGEPADIATALLPGFEQQPAEASEGQVSTVYFNIDLVANLNIPIANATYNVYASLGEFKSNVLTISTTIK